MPRIQYINDETGSFQETHGSDSRLNVSSRSDARSFYVSRDNGQSYVLHIEDDDAVAGDLIGYLRNDSKNKRLYVRAIEISCENVSTIKIGFADSTAPTGTLVTPVNLNRASSNDADVTAVGNGAVGGAAIETFFDAGRVEAGGEHHFEFNDSLILGQNDAIIVEYDTGTTGDLELEIFFFIE